MPQPGNYDLNFRPATYWDNPEVRDAILRAVRGSRRRELVRRLLDGELEGPVDAVLLAPALEPALRRAWGAIDPCLMGGEYLPEPEPGEIEVVRLEMDSTTGDVVAVRARLLSDGGIAWRIVDEYLDDTGPWTPASERSERPLSFGEMVDFLDRALPPGKDFTGLVVGFYEFNSDCAEDPDVYRDFFHVSSPFYPQLGRWYDEAVEEAWRKLKARGEESRASSGGEGAAAGQELAEGDLAGVRP